MVELVLRGGTGGYALQRGVKLPLGQGWVASAVGAARDTNLGPVGLVSVIRVQWRLGNARSLEVLLWRSGCAYRA